MPVKVALADRAGFLNMIKAGTSLSEVAKIAGVTKSMVWRWKQAARIRPDSVVKTPKNSRVLRTQRPPCYNTVVTRADGTIYVEDKWACGKWKLKPLEDE